MLSFLPSFTTDPAFSLQSNTSPSENYRFWAEISFNQAVAQNYVLTQFCNKYCLSTSNCHSFRKDLCFTADFLLILFIYFIFFYFNARAPRCIGWPAWNFAHWSVL